MDGVILQVDCRVGRAIGGAALDPAVLLANLGQGAGYIERVVVREHERQGGVLYRFVALVVDDELQFLHMLLEQEIIVLDFVFCADVGDFLQQFFGAAVLVRRVRSIQAGVRESRHHCRRTGIREFVAGIEHLLEFPGRDRRRHFRQVRRGERQVFVDDVAGEADFHALMGNGLAELLLEHLLQLPTPQLDDAGVVLQVGIAAAQRLGVVDAHHVRLVPAA